MRFVVPRVVPAQPIPCAVLGLAVVAALLALTGCVTPPVTFKSTPGSVARVAALHRVAVAPPDVEVQEISAGGVTEKRDDWSAQVSGSVTAALTHATGYMAAPVLDPAQKEELAEVQALVRLLTVNHLNALFAPEILNSGHRTLNFQVGRIDRLVDACGADALLLVFARDNYTTGGRTTLEVLGFAQPVPALAGAMLVDRDGTVLWFNYYIEKHEDLRDAGNAQEFAQKLLAGLPRR